MSSGNVPSELKILGPKGRAGSIPALGILRQAQNRLKSRASRGALGIRLGLCQGILRQAHVPPQSSTDEAIQQ